MIGPKPEQLDSVAILHSQVRAAGQDSNVDISANDALSLDPQIRLMSGGDRLDLGVAELLVRWMGGYSRTKAMLARGEEVRSDTKQPIGKHPQLPVNPIQPPRRATRSYEPARGHERTVAQQVGAIWIRIGVENCARQGFPKDRSPTAPPLLGRGVMASLRQNPRQTDWTEPQNLLQQQEALAAARNRRACEFEL